jgi:hypothetical protein
VRGGVEADLRGRREGGEQLRGEGGRRALAFGPSKVDDVQCIQIVRLPLLRVRRWSSKEGMAHFVAEALPVLDRLGYDELRQAGPVAADAGDDGGVGLERVERFHGVLNAKSDNFDIGWCWGRKIGTS